MANYCPPMNRLFYVPRKETLESTVVKYPRSAQAASENTLNSIGASIISQVNAFLGNQNQARTRNDKKKVNNANAPLSIPKANPQQKIEQKKSNPEDNTDVSVSSFQ